MTTNSKWLLANLLAVMLTASIAIPTVRQNNLNARLLQAVSSSPSESIVRSLLRAGANPNCGDPERDDTPLIRALSCPYPDPNTVLALLNAGASTQPVGEAQVPIASCLVYSPISSSTVSVYRKILEELKAHGADLEGHDSLGFTPLMRAVWAGNPAGTQALLEMGANPNVSDNLGQNIFSMTDNEGPQTEAELNKLLRRYMAARSIETPKNVNEHPHHRLVKQ